MSKISRTVQGGEEVARNVRKGCRTLEEEKKMYHISPGICILEDQILVLRAFRVLN
jgi:hypothetical protein